MTKPKAGVTAKHPRLLLCATILASSLALVDGSVTNVALPAIDESFKASPADLQWVINAFLLPLSALLLLGGAAGDRFGRRRLMVAGIILFAAASMLCAAAPSLAVLLAGRALQGVGAALTLPNSLAILGDAFSGPAKGKAIGVWAAAGAVAGALGPVIGGGLIDTVGWRAIFLINLPLAAMAVILALRFVDEARREADAPALDIAGGALATLALGALTWGLTVGSGPDGWSGLALGAIAAGVLLLAAFIWTEHHLGDRAMMPLGLFGSKSFIGLSLLTLLLYGALGGLLTLIPYVLIEAAGYSGTEAGASLLPFPALLALASPVMGAVAGRIGAKAPLTIGPLLVGVGFLLALRIGPEGNYWTEVLPSILVVAVGMSAAVAPLTTAVLSSVDARHTGSASGFNSALARTGGMVATALLGAVLAAKGAALIGQFHIAAVVCAAACVAASVCAFLLVDGRKAAKPKR